MPVKKGGRTLDEAKTSFLVVASQTVTQSTMQSLCCCWSRSLQFLIISSCTISKMAPRENDANWWKEGSPGHQAANDAAAVNDPSH